MEEATTSADRSQRFTRFASWTLGSLFLVHLIVLGTYAVNIPYWDEWDMFTDDSTGAITWRWFFGWSNEHRPVLTKLEVFLASRWGGWNLVTLQLFHFVCYGGLLLLILRTARKTAPQLPGWAACAFCFFLLSSSAWEVHSWGVTFCWTLSLVLFVTAAGCLFHESQSTGWLLAGTWLMVLSFFSNDVGLLTGLVLAAWFSLFKLIRAWRRPERVSSRAREIAGLALVLTTLGFVLVFYFHGYRKPTYHPALAFPYSGVFWTSFTNLLSYGFGFATRSVVLGLFCLFLGLGPIVVEFWRRGTQVQTSFWRLSGITVGIIGALAGIAVARGGFGSSSGKDSRYAIVAMMLVPFTAAAWSVAVAQSRRVKALALAGLWVFCFVGFADDWTSEPYRRMAEARRVGLECVRQYYTKGGEAKCPTIYPAPLATRLMLAARLHLSFYENIRGTGLLDVDFRNVKDLLAAHELSQLPAGRMAGYIDSVQMTCEGLNSVCEAAAVAGWAVDPFANVPAIKVWLVSGESVLAAAMTGSDRLDVARALKAPATTGAGWHVEVHAGSSSMRLESTRLAAYALLADGRRIVKLDGPLNVITSQASGSNGGPR